MPIEKESREKMVVDAMRRAMLGEAAEGVLSEAEGQAFLVLADQIPDTVMQVFLAGLSGKYRRQILKSLPVGRQRVWLSQTQDKQALPLVFAALPHEAQKALLSEWFVSDRDRYLLIKASASQRTIVVGDVWVRTDTALPQLVRAEAENVLDAIQKEAVSVALFADFLKLRVGKYPAEALESMGQLVLETFIGLKISLATPASFLMHLKCHLYHDYLMSEAPNGRISAYAQLLDQLVGALAQMPDGDWVMKVLAQMPRGALVQVMRRLKDGKQAPQEAQRKQSAKLLHEIGTRVDRPEFETVRLAYDA